MRSINLLLLALAFASSPSAPVFADEPADVVRTQDVIYGHKDGLALTLDVFAPAKKNGAGILWMASGGWVSNREKILPKLYQPLLDRGYVVFAVMHGSQPRYVVEEIQADVHRAVRFVRHHAADWGIDPRQIGVGGASAGGHLSLVIGTQGGPGAAEAPDPVDRESSAVGAVACFFPPSDLLNWSSPGEDWVAAEPGRDSDPAFAPGPLTPELRQAIGRKLSPIYHVSAAMPPTLVVHGDADRLVPLYQSQRMQQRCQEVGARFRLIVKPGGGHGWQDAPTEVALFASWFDEHLRGIKSQPPVAN